MVACARSQARTPDRQASRLARAGRLGARDHADRPQPRRAAGLAAGEPVDRNDDLLGSTVNLASRICQAADGGQILVGNVVQELGAADGFIFSPVGDRTLKGFAEPIALFELRAGAPA